jgi:hypothetical protein
MERILDQKRKKRA